jgi:uncharacterized membrane protein
VRNVEGRALALPRFNEKTTRSLFQLSLLSKAAFALAEILAAIGAYFVTQGFVLKIADRLTQGELLHHPRDLIANRYRHRPDSAV